MPQRSLDQIYSTYGGQQSPAAPAPRKRSLDEIYGSATGGGATTPSTEAPGGFFDRLKGMSGRDWAATVTRLGTGYLSGIPSMVPGVGTLIGGAIGGAGEGLAQLIGGDDFDIGSMGVAGGLGMVPMGKVFGGAAKLAKGAGLLEKATALGSNLSGNALKGGLLNAGADVSHRFSQTGELPIKDYSLREEVIPAAIGAGGGALSAVVSNRAVGKLGRGTQDGAGGAQGAFDFDGPVTPGGVGSSPAGVSAATLARARAAIRDPEAASAFDAQWGAQGPAPRSTRPAPAPATLTPGSRSMSLADYAAQWQPREGAALPAPGRNINQPVRMDVPADEFVPNALTPGSPGETLQDYVAGLAGGADPSLPGTNPRGLAADPPTQPSPARAVDDWFFGRGNRPASIAPEQPVIEGMPPWQQGGAAPELAPAAAPVGRPAPPSRPWEIVDNLLQGKPMPADDLGFQPQPSFGDMGVVRPGDVQPVLPDASGIPKPIRDLWESLKPRWEQALASQAGDDIPFQVDQFEPLEDFAARIMSDDPRMLMHQERGARAAAEAAQAMQPRPGQAVSQLIDPAPVAQQGNPMFPPGTPRPQLSKRHVGAGSVSEAPARGEFKPITTARQRAQEIAKDFIERAKAGPVPEGDDVDLMAQGIAREHQARAFAVEELQREFPLGSSFKKLPPDLQGEIRRIYEELVSFPFTKRTFNDPEPGMGGTMGVVAGAGGSPVYHDIMDGRSGSRKSVINALASFIEKGKKPTAVVQRAYNVALREMAGDPTLRRRMLPPDAGFGGGDAGFTDPNLMMPVGGALTGAAVGPWVDDENPLRGSAAGAVAGALAGMGGAKYLRGEFDNVRTTTRPRSAPKSDRFDIGGDAGFMSPELAYPLGGAVAGGLAGPLVDKEQADPLTSTIGGAGTGALLGALVKSPALVERMRSSGLFSGAAIPKSALGNVGALGAFAAEHPGSAADIIREAFSPETLTAGKKAWTRGMVREGIEEPNSVFSYPGRAIGMPDAMARDVLQRAMSKRSGSLPGISSSEDLAEAGRYTLSGDPSTELAQDAIKHTKNPYVRMIAPVVRTASNMVERGIERTPGLGGLAAVREWSGASPELARRRQMLGAVAALGGVGAGMATAPGTELEELGEWAPYAAALGGPYGLPFALSSVAGQTMGSDKLNNGPLAALNQVYKSLLQQIPLIGIGQTDTAATSMLRPNVPYAGALRAFSPVNPRDFDTSSSFFGPALAQIPGLNEYLFPVKRNAPGPVR